MKASLKRIVRSAGLRREHVAAARVYCERHVLATAGRRPKRSRGRILCYHSLGQPEFGVNDVAPARFRRHVELALESGFRFVSASEIARTGGGSKDLAITFDDAWNSVLTHAVPILAEYRIPLSVFVVSEWAEHRNAWLAERALDWRGVEHLMAAGAEIGSHSATHPDFGKLDPARFEAELAGSARTIEQRLGIRPASFAIPLGQSMNWTEAASEAAKKAGYEIIYAQAEETRPAGTVPRTFVTRFDGDGIFKSLLSGTFDHWEEWV
jgi:peptidoglycan/xylan/chitin deacetylase (PgdA/CDA1 family)